MTDIWTYIDGDWHDEAMPLMAANTNAAWLGNTVFDGARKFEGVTPDLDRHCRRVIRSAEIMGMLPNMDGETVEGLVRDGLKRIDGDDAIYIRPMFWIEDGLGPIVPESTRFCIVLQRMAMPEKGTGFSACLSTYRKPSPETAPTSAKATCLYPQATIAWGDARKRGFDNAVMLDINGAVAEFTMQNLFLVKDGVISTPQTNGMLLNGITRQRAINLLEQLGHKVIERRIMPDELLSADEIISTGNHARIFPCVKYEDNEMGMGPIYQKLRDAYWHFSGDC